VNCTQVSEVLPPSAVGRLACLTPPKRKDDPFARMLEHAKPEEFLLKSYFCLHAYIKTKESVVYQHLTHLQAYIKPT